MEQKYKSRKSMADSFGKELLREVMKQIENGAKLDDEYMEVD